MTSYMTNFPGTEFFEIAKRALRYVGRGAMFIVDRITDTGARDLAKLDGRTLSDTGYDRIDWDSENGEAIQSALIKIYDW